MNKFFENISYFRSLLSTKTEQQVARILFNYSIKLSTAESCTGGLLSSRLTDIAGSSAYTKENFITYANEAKIEILDVKPETIETYGAVSEECAKEMAEGLYNKTGCDIAISTTGIAGPTSNEEDKSIGLMYVAIKNKYSLECKEINVNPQHSRRMIKYIFTQEALKFLTDFLNKNYTSISQLTDSTIQDVSQ